MIKVLVLLSFFLLSTSYSYAESSASVKVNNDVSSSSTNDTNVETNIRVETNGHVTTYSSDKAEDIEVKAENGKSEIKVNGETVSGTAETITDPSPTPKPTEEPEKEAEEKKEEEENEKGFFEIILDAILSFFN